MTSLLQGTALTLQDILSEEYYRCAELQCDKRELNAIVTYHKKIQHTMQRQLEGARCTEFHTVVVLRLVQIPTARFEE